MCMIISWLYVGSQIVPRTRRGYLDRFRYQVASCMKRWAIPNFRWTFFFQPIKCSTSDLSSRKRYPGYDFIFFFEPIKCSTFDVSSRKRFCSFDLTFFFNRFPITQYRCPPNDFRSTFRFTLFFWFENDNLPNRCSIQFPI